MDSTEAFNVSVIENFSFWCLGSVYLNTSPAADVCFAFLPAKPARLFGSWSLCCIITSFTCSSRCAFLQESLLYLVLLSNETIKLFIFHWKLHIPVFGKHWNVPVASSSWCTTATVTHSPSLRRDVPWWAFAASRLKHCSGADTSIKQLPKYQGQAARDGIPACTWAGAILPLCLWGEGLCCAGEPILLQNVKCSRSGLLGFCCYLGNLIFDHCLSNTSCRWT